MATDTAESRAELFKNERPVWLFESKTIEFYSKAVSVCTEFAALENSNTISPKATHCVRGPKTWHGYKYSLTWENKK
jgi:hypothetical protein